MGAVPVDEPAVDVAGLDDLPADVPEVVAVVAESGDLPAYAAEAVGVEDAVEDVR